MGKQKEQLNKALELIADELNVPESRYEQAESRYKAIGEWFCRDKSIIAKYDPVIYVQGSFRLGTAIKPISEEEDYDIDLVCVLNERKINISQNALKFRIGLEVQRYCSSNGIIAEPENNRRCWTINYADGAQFHLDILPALPNGKQFKALLESRNFSSEWAEDSIAITDKTLMNYSHITEDWPVSNPVGYSKWFRKRQVAELRRIQESRSLMYASIEEIPVHKSRTVLQRSIQLLKRHRDILFSNDADHKPISIILTTLATHAYSGEDNLFDAIANILQNMEDHIEEREGVYWIQNPVNPLENFADKWAENPKLIEGFDKWLQHANHNLIQEFSGNGVQLFTESLRNSLGNRAVNRAKTAFEAQYANKTFSSKRSIVPYAPHKQEVQWPYWEEGSVSISAFIDKNGFRRENIPSGFESVPKGASLEFRAATNVKRPYHVFWQVVNTGDEARYSEDLRGDFYDGQISKGKLIRSEGTKYKGQHWAECFIVKSGVCVARSGEFIINIR